MRRLAFLAAAGLAIAGCGSSNGPGASVAGGSGGLVWTKPPSVFKPPRLPHDRVLAGTVRNASLREFRVKASDLRILDAHGDLVEGQGIFLNGYLHSLFPPTREPQLPDRELRRIGRLLKIAPGQTAPLTIAWRLKPGQDPPTRLVIGAGSLPIPRG